MYSGMLNSSCVVRVKGAGAQNALGEAVVVWTDGAPVRCRVEGLGGGRVVEVRIGKQSVRAEWRVWLEAGVQVRELDRIVWSGRVLEVGLVRRFAGGVGAHLEVYCVEARVN